MNEDNTTGVRQRVDEREGEKNTNRQTQTEGEMRRQSESPRKKRVTE